MISSSPLELSDLRSWISNGRPAEDSPPVRLVVIGDPVAHSRSPGMHQPALDERGLPMRYGKLHVRPGEVGEAFRLMQALGFVGCNATVPHKLEALENCTAVDAPARLFQAVNTVRFLPNGTIEGSNTDGPGLAAAVQEAFGRPLAGSRVAVIGAGGGAGRAAALQCALLGCPSVVLANRTLSKAEAVAAEMAGVAPGIPIRIVALDDPQSLREALADCELLVNATSAGMKPEDPLPVPAEALHPGLAVYDMIYSPPETRLLAAARALGAPAANGLSMLIHQGAISFARWFGASPPVETMRKALDG